MQRGPLSAWPLSRIAAPGDPEWSFRLIDFGRSVEFNEESIRREEEMDVGKLFKHMLPWNGRI
jgi:hypothetical protein